MSDWCRIAIVLGVTADIGREFTLRLLRDGWRVIGLGRDRARISDLEENTLFTFVPCDLSSKVSIDTAVTACLAKTPDWSLFLSSAGTMEPIGPFFDVDFDTWEGSIQVNFTAQLRVLHGLWPARARAVPLNVCFLAGGGTNNAFTNYSAYCVAKIGLIKICELLDDENAGGNFFIVGPGFMNTRIHAETLRAGDAAGAGLEKTRAFLESEGTSHDELFACVQWCMTQGRSVAGGRNFSAVHDPWRAGGAMLAEILEGDPNAHRLRRHPARGDRYLRSKNA